MVKEIWDIHTHLLPGIDDGAKDWETCLAMIARSVQLGVTHIVATPHYLPWKENDNPDKIRKLCVEAEQKARKSLDREITILPGQEIYFHEDMLEGLRSGRILTMADTSFVLVEFGLDVTAGMLYQHLMRIRSASYYPILAHAERYGALRENGRLEELISSGVKIQLNIQSLEGSWFDSTAVWCRKRLLRREADFLSTDMHNLTSRPPFKKESFSWLDRKIDASYRKALLGENAAEIFAK